MSKILDKVFARFLEVGGWPLAALILGLIVLAPSFQSSWGNTHLGTPIRVLLVLVSLGLFIYGVLFGSWWQKLHNKKHRKFWRTIAGVVVSIIVIVLGHFLIFKHDPGNDILTPSAETPTLTNTPEPSTMAAATNTPLLTSTPEITLTPNPLALLENCNRVEPPCYHTVEPDEYAVSIARRVYGNRHEIDAGLIANLFRDDRGYIRRFMVADLVIVPSRNDVVNLDYMLYYLNEEQELDYGICEWGDLASYRFPCLYISAGEGYQVLATEFYRNESAFTPERQEQALRMANRIRFVNAIHGLIVDDLQSIDKFSIGDVVVIPALPPPSSE